MVNILEYIFSIKPADDAFHYHIRVLGFKFNIRKDMDFPPTACSIKNINNDKNITYKHHTGIVFAAFTPDGIIPENTIEYLKELKKYSDYIVLVGDCPIFKSETKKIEGIVDAYMFKRHQEYDFGSYKRGFEILKRNKVLDNIDNLILCNDSVIYNGGSLEEFFINAKTNHFYGLTLNKYGLSKTYEYGEYAPHLQSYLLSVSKEIFSKKYFSKFLSGVRRKKNQLQVVLSYEMGLSRLIKNKRYCLASYYQQLPDFILTNPCYYYLNPDSNFPGEKLFYKKKILKEPRHFEYSPEDAA